MLKKLEKLDLFNVITLFLLIYFSTKILWDTNVNIIKYFVLFAISFYSTIQVFKMLFNKSNYKKYLIIWLIFCAYIVVNALFVNFEMACFKRAIYEYIFYSYILWLGCICSKYIKFDNIIKILGIFGVLIACLSFVEFIFNFYIIPMDDYNTYVTFEGEMITRAKVFTRSYLSHGVLLGIYSLFNYYTYHKTKNNLYFVFSIFCLVSILSTSSRGPLVATFAGFFALLVFLHKESLKKFTSIKSILFSKAAILTILVILIFVLMIIFEIQTGIKFIDHSILRIRSIFNWVGDAGNVGRIAIWSKWVNIAKENFVFGIGASKSGSWRVSDLGVTESAILKHFAELGIIGFSLYYLLIVTIIKDVFTKVKNKIDDKFWMCCSVIILIFVDSLILQITEEIQIAFFFWFFLGIILSYLGKNDKNNSILYYSNVDWYWIKQRPHFVAEGLAESYDLKFVYQHRYNRTNMQTNRKDSIIKHVNPIFVIPTGDGYKLTRKLNHLIKKIYISILILYYDFEFIMIAYPTQIYSIPSFFKGKLIYDCMDNHIAMSEDETIQKELFESEEIAVSKADIVLYSSDRLKVELQKRYPNLSDNKMKLIRNAYNGQIYDMNDIESNHDKFKLCYFGTISSWFNFEYLENSIKEFDNIEYYLYGPIESGIQIPNNDRIKLMGTVEHSKLKDIVKEMDCLIMPFILNDIIESVDPVKLYEYINFNKNIITVYYNEIKRFEPFVNFYSNQQEFNTAIEQLIKDNKVKYDLSSRIEFLENNNWKSRINDIKAILENINEN